MGRPVSSVFSNSVSEDDFGKGLAENRFRLSVKSCSCSVDRVCVSAIVCCLRFVSCVCLWAFLCGHISTGDFFHG